MPSCLILQVQDDLEYLRAAARGGRGGESEAGLDGVDAETLEMILARTQQGMQAVAEQVLQTTQDKITTLPAVARKENAESAKPSVQKKAPKPGYIIHLASLKHIRFFSLCLGRNEVTLCRNCPQGSSAW